MPNSIAIAIAFLVLLTALAWWRSNVRSRKLRAGLAAQYGEQFLWVSPLDRSYIALDVANKRLAINALQPSAATAGVGSYPFTAVRSVEVSVDYKTLARLSREGASSPPHVLDKARMNSASPADVGPALQPRASSGYQQSVVALTVTVQDAANPLYRVSFYRGLLPANAAPWQADTDPSMAALRRIFEALRAGMEATGGLAPVQAELPAGSMGATCMVQLVSCRNKIEAIKAVRTVRPELGLAAAKGMVDAMPSVLLADVSRETAEAVSRQFALQGVGVTIL